MAHKNIHHFPCNQQSVSAYVDYDGQTILWSDGGFVLGISLGLGDLTSVGHRISQLWCLGDTSDGI